MEISLASYIASIDAVVKSDGARETTSEVVRPSSLYVLFIVLPPLDAGQIG